MSEYPSLLERIEELIQSDKFTLPVLSPLAFKLQTVTAQGRHDVAEIERLVQSDPALASEVLRAANSAYFGGLASIRTIRNAIVRLGAQQVVRLAYLATERFKYRAHDAELSAMLAELWRHSSSTAVAAQWLSRRIKANHLEDEAFLGGLLHDIGKLLILRALDQLKETDKNRPVTSPELIQEVLLAAHSRLGCGMLQRWNIGEPYGRIAAEHHNPNFDPTDLLLAIVRLANEASRKAGLGLDPDPSLVLAATPEAGCLKASEMLLAELEIMLEDSLGEPA